MVDLSNCLASCQVYLKSNQITFGFQDKLVSFIVINKGGYNKSMITNMDIGY